MKTAFRHYCSLLMLLALLTASGLPAGFMPNLARGDGTNDALAPLVLCTASGLQTVYVPKDQIPAPATPVDDSTQHQKHQPCPYAPAQAAADMPAPPVIKTPAPYRAAAILYKAVQNLRQKLPQKNFRSQAPPLA